jgi:Fic family protein
VGLLAGTGRNLTNPALLIAPYLRREAVLSSRIEGTMSTLADLYEDEATGHARGDVREVRNYLTAYEYGLGALKELPLSLRLLRAVHKHMMDGVRGHERHPGRFRSYQNWIGGSPGAPIDEAGYAPRAATVLGVSAPTARAAIRDLAALGVLRELTGRKWGQLFLAEEVLQATRGGVDDWERGQD